MKKTFTWIFSALVVVVFTGVLSGCGAETVQEPAPVIGAEKKGGIKDGKKQGGGMVATQGIDN